MAESSTPTAYHEGGWPENGEWAGGLPHTKKFTYGQRELQTPLARNLPLFAAVSLLPPFICLRDSRKTEGKGTQRDRAGGSSHREARTVG